MCNRRAVYKAKRERTLRCPKQCEFKPSGTTFVLFFCYEGAVNYVCSLTTLCGCFGYVGCFGLMEWSVDRWAETGEHWRKLATLLCQRTSINSLGSVREKEVHDKTLNGVFDTEGG